VFARRQKLKVQGIIAPERLYTREGVLRAAGIGDESLLEAKKSGMVKAIRCGTRVYFSGDELIAWIKSHRSDA